MLVLSLLVYVSIHSQDNLRESVIFFYHVASGGVNLRSSGLTITYEKSHLASLKLSFYVGVDHYGQRTPSS